jgi:hypothetical protein
MCVIDGFRMTLFKNVVAAFATHGIFVWSCAQVVAYMAAEKQSPGLSREKHASRVGHDFDDYNRTESGEFLSTQPKHNHSLARIGENRAGGTWGTITGVQ